MDSGLRDSLTKLAFYDELVKISASAEARHVKAKKWLKNTALISAGAGAGTGLAFLADHYAPKILGSHWSSLSKKQRIAILSPLVAAGSVAVPIIAKKMYEEKMRRMR